MGIFHPPSPGDSEESTNLFPVGSATSVISLAKPHRAKAGRRVSAPAPTPSPAFSSPPVSRVRPEALEMLSPCCHFILNEKATALGGPVSRGVQEAQTGGFGATLLPCDMCHRPTGTQRAGKAHGGGRAFQNTIFGVSFAYQTWTFSVPVSDSK